MLIMKSSAKSWYWHGRGSIKKVWHSLLLTGLYLLALLTRLKQD